VKTTKDKKSKTVKKATKPVVIKKKENKSSIKKTALKKPVKVKSAAKSVKKPVSVSKIKTPVPKKTISKPKKIVSKKINSKTEKKIVKPTAPSVKKEVPVVKAKSAEIPSKPATAKATTIEKEKKSEIVSKRAAAAERMNEVLAVSNTIPVQKREEISNSKIASISSSITNPIRSSDSYSIRPEKEPRGKYELEFVIHASAEMLFEFLSTPSGLSEWFCDDVNIRNGIYTFIWEDQLQQARLLKTIDLQVVRFQWVDKTDGSYFEFRIQQDDLTNDISLIITDFGETTAERESGKQLWNSQVEKLMQVIGSI